MATATYLKCLLKGSFYDDTTKTVTSEWGGERPFCFWWSSRPLIQGRAGPCGIRMPPAILPSGSSEADIITSPLANFRL